MTAALLRPGRAMVGITPIARYKSIGSIRPSFWLSLMVLAISQATLCAAFALQHRTVTRARWFNEARATRQSSLPSKRGHNLRHSHALRRLHRPVMPLFRGGPPIIPSSLFSTVDSDNAGFSSSSHASRPPIESEDEFGAETRRLMTIPTIDIKLELQMRGVEHRDAFEKLDLARRLAEARRIDGGSQGARADTKTAGRSDADDGRGSSSSGSEIPSASDRKEEEEEQDEWEGAQGGTWGTSRDESQDPIKSRTEAEKPAKVSVDDVYDRDVSKAMTMDKQAVTRKLNVMGIAHSRLSDLSILAKQYADGRRDARAAAEEARRFQAEQAAIERRRLLALGRAELEGRLRAAGVAFSRLATDAALAELVADIAEEDISQRSQRSYGQGRSEKAETADDDRDAEEIPEWERWTSGERWREAKASVGPAWTIGEPDPRAEEGDEEVGNEEDDDVRNEGSTSDDFGKWTASWRNGSSSQETEFEAEGSVRSSARSSDVASAVPNAAVEGTGSSVDRKADVDTSKLASLRTRAERMSSRELMNALDSLNAQYRIPSPRGELQEAFVSAVLSSQKTSGSDGKRGQSPDIVPLDPYAADVQDGDKERASEHEQHFGFETYHAALRWARQLTLDDVLAELQYRGVQCNPKAGFTFLTRLLADEVLADEELMKAESQKGAYRAQWDIAMAMTAQELIRELREGGQRADVTWSKDTLVEKFATMASSREGESPRTVTGNSNRTSSRASSSRRATPDANEGSNGSNGSSGSSSVYQKPGGSGRRGGSKGSRRRVNGGGGVEDPLDFGDKGEMSDEDALLELEDAARTVGGAAWVAARETAGFVTAAASGAFLGAFPREYGDYERGDGTSASPARGGTGAPSQSRRPKGRQPSRGESERRAKEMRERASGVSRAATGFAQSSVNRAGMAVVSSAANGVLRAAEAAADWAGGGTLAREHVLLFIAVFCLVFKRGIGASVALLVVIRAGRISVERLLAEGFRREHVRRMARGGVGVSGAAAGPVGAGSAPSQTGGIPPTRRRRSPAGKTTSAGASERRATAGAGQATRRPTASQKEGTKKARRGRPKPVPKKRERGKRKPLWDESDDESNKGCVVM